MTAHRSLAARLIACASLAALAACGDDEPAAPPPPVLTTVTVSLPLTTIAVGQTTTATAAGVDQNNVAIETGAITWSSSTPASATVSQAGIITGVGAGTTQIIATAGTRSGQLALTVIAPAAIRISEVESNGGDPGDWIELYNPTNAPVDLAGWGLKDNDSTRTFKFPAGTTIAAGGYLVAEEAAFGFGLGAADDARLYSPFGVLVDAYSWTAHATSSYGRCPTSTGAFVTMTSVTKGLANDCRPMVKVNEVESNGGTPDWIELFNAGTATVDLSNFVVKDNDDTHVTTLAAGTTLAPGAYLVVEEATLGYGLGGADAARLFDATGTLVDSYTWTQHATTTYGRCPDGTGAFATTTVVTKGAANDCRAAVKINEVESSGGTPGDWIEIVNTGAGAVDLSNWIVKDDDDTRTTRLGAGTTLAPGAYLVIEEATLGFGLGAQDAARIFDANGALIDSYSWTSHAATTYGRCPDGSGAFTTTMAPTKGAANSCVPAGPTTSPWPGGSDVETVDGTSVFGGNLSGLTYEGAVNGSPSLLWAVRNGPGTLYRLVFIGGIWTPDPANNWNAGKALRYTDNLGNPDAEGVTFAGGGSAGGIYVATERNNDASTVSRNSVLRFNPASAGATLQATNDWNLTADLPVVGANLGIEAITWVPDSMLVAKGFFDESKNRAYAPADYADHGTGLFFVGVEGNGIIYVYALNHVTNGFTRVATITTGYPGVMGLEYDRDTGYLWATCDDGCNNTAGVLEVDTAAGSATRGRFRAPRNFARPSALPNINNEGFAFAPNSECSNGFKAVFWADDSETGGHSIRRATMPCGLIAVARALAGWRP